MGPKVKVKIMNGVTIDYRFEGNDMTDDEYQDQEEKTFEVTEQMLYDLVMRHVDVPDGLDICSSNFYVNCR